MKLVPSNQSIEITASTAPQYDPSIVMRIGVGHLLRFVLTPAESLDLAQRLTAAVSELKAEKR
jgi:hypothetical protein